MSRAAVALGSNLGDRLAHLRRAVDRLRQLGRVEAVSGLYETEPVGPAGQDPYLNAVVILDTPLAPAELLVALHDVEQEEGRTREQRWGPRTLDLDLIAYEDLRLSLPDLEVPHPRARERRFVLAPLVEVWPEAPVGPGLTARRALEGLPRRPWVRRFSGDWLDEPPDLGSAAVRWVAAQAVLIAVWVVALLADTSLPPPWWRWIPGGLVLLAGAVLAVAGVRSLGSALTPLPQPRPGASLVAHGPYRLVRHPIYGGLILAMGGAAWLVGSEPALVVAVAAAVFFAAKARAEESALGVNFPGYLEYRRRVRKRFLPWVW